MNQQSVDSFLYEHVYDVGEGKQIGLVAMVTTVLEYNYLFC